MKITKITLEQDIPHIIYDTVIELDSEGNIIIRG